MANTSVYVPSAEEREEYEIEHTISPGQESIESPMNPFLSNSEISSAVSPIEEYEENPTDNPHERHTLLKPASSTNRNPYNRSHSAQPSTDSTRAARRHTRINLLTPPNANASPVLICLHGSNDSCMRSWLGMIEVLYKQGYTILLYDRPPPSTLGGADLKPHRAVSELCSYLYSADLRGPFVIIAHSYGGAIARLFVHQKPHQVAGMVLVETGQETALAPSTEEEQYRRQILGDAPLAVVRGNCMRDKQDAWVKAAAEASSPAEKAKLEPQRLMLEQWEAEDEKLKKKQLGLSRNSHYAQVPDCGHHPIRDKPDAVVQEVRWVMGRLAASGAQGQVQTAAQQQRPGLVRNLSSAGAGMRRGLSTRLASGLQRTFSKKGRV